MKNYRLVCFGLDVADVKLKTGFSPEFVFGNGITNIEGQPLINRIEVVSLVKCDC